MKIIRVAKKGDKVEKKLDAKMMPEDLKNAAVHRKRVADLIKSINTEFERAFSGGEFDPGYVKEKTDALANYAKLIA